MIPLCANHHVSAITNAVDMDTVLAGPTDTAAYETVFSQAAEGGLQLGLDPAQSKRVDDGMTTLRAGLASYKHRSRSPCGTYDVWVDAAVHHWPSGIITKLVVPRPSFVVNMDIAVLASDLLTLTLTRAATGDPIIETCVRDSTLVEAAFACLGRVLGKDMLYEKAHLKILYGGTLVNPLRDKPFKDILHDDTRSVLQDVARQEAARRVKQRPPQRRTLVRKRPAAQRVKRPAAQAGVRKVSPNDR